MPEIISRKDAKARGLTRYFTGKACKRGHSSERFVCNCRCIECMPVRKQSKEYMREYEKKRRFKNPEKVRLNRRNSRLRHLEKNRKRDRERGRKINDLIIVLREEMPELLKEFGL